MSRGSVWILAGVALVVGSAATHGDFGWLGALILGLQFFFGGDFGGDS